MRSKKQASLTTTEYQPTNTNSGNPSTNHHHSIRAQSFINVVPCEARPKIDSLGFSVDLESIEAGERNLDAASGGKSTICGMASTLHGKWYA